MLKIEKLDLIVAADHDRKENKYQLVLIVNSLAQTLKAQSQYLCPSLHALFHLVPEDPVQPNGPHCNNPLTGYYCSEELAHYVQQKNVFSESKLLKF